MEQQDLIKQHSITEFRKQKLDLPEYIEREPLFSRLWQSIYTSVDRCRPPNQSVYETKHNHDNKI